MRPQGDEPRRLDPVATLEHFLDGGFQVVIADPGGDAVEVVERPHVTIQEHLLGLGQVNASERLARRRQAHDEDRNLQHHPGNLRGDRAEIDLGLLPQRVMLRDHHITKTDLITATNLAHIPANRALRDIRVELVDETLPHPSSGVALLARRHPIIGKPAIHDWFPTIHLRRQPLRPLP